jgi:hypothetical protein
MAESKYRARKFNPAESSMPEGKPWSVGREVGANAWESESWHAKQGPAMARAAALNAAETIEEEPLTPAEQADAQRIIHGLEQQLAPPAFAMTDELRLDLFAIMAPPAPAWFTADIGPRPSHQLPAEWDERLRGLWGKLQTGHLDHPTPDSPDSRVNMLDNDAVQCSLADFEQLEAESARRADIEKEARTWEGRRMQAAVYQWPVVYAQQMVQMMARTRELMHRASLQAAADAAADQEDANV